MIKETIVYKDYNGNERTEDFFFHLNESELLKMQMGVKGGYVAYVNSIISAQDQPTLIEIFEELIEKSYGVKDLDGKGFRKSKETFEIFKSTEAYSKLFMKLATDDEYAAKFINGVIPADLAAKVAEKQAAGEIPTNLAAAATI